jgi:hypothetical protein
MKRVYMVFGINALCLHWFNPYMLIPFSNYCTKMASTWVHPWFYWGSCYSIFSFMCMFCRSLFVLFLLVIVLSVRRRFTDSDYHFGIFKLFLFCNRYSSCFGYSQVYRYKKLKTNVSTFSVIFKHAINNRY